jgi:hypothetical protein
MSEMSIPAPIETRLRAHVDSVVAWSRIPKREREDVAEEMYGHLWLRWHESVSAGSGPEEAAERAISTFGRADRIGLEMTGAYHSRLYASTIGVLLPIAARPSEWPVGVGRIEFLLAATAILFALSSAGSILSLTPVRAVISLTGACIGLFVMVLARYAFSRAQRWSLVFARFIVLIVLVSTIASFAYPNEGRISVSLLGPLALVCARPAFGADLMRWTSASPRMSRGLAIGVSAAVLASLALTSLAPYAPDPTQVTARDLHLSLTATCSRDADGYVTEMNLTTTFRWDRLDLLPDGLIAAPDLNKMGGEKILYRFRAGEGSRADGYRDHIVGQDVTYGAQAPWYDATNATFEIEGTAIPASTAQELGSSIALGNNLPNPSAGSTYTIRSDRVWLSTLSSIPTHSTDRDPLIAATYWHKDRFVVQAVASCSASQPSHSFPYVPGMEGLQ